MSSSLSLLSLALSLVLTICIGGILLRTSVNYKSVRDWLVLLHVCVHTCYDQPLFPSHYAFLVSLSRSKLYITQFVYDTCARNALDD